MEYTLEAIRTTMSTVEMVAALRGGAHDLTQWLQSAEAALLGRRVKVTRGPNAGRDFEVEKLRLAAGLNGYRLLLALDGIMYELGRDCELEGE